MVFVIKADRMLSYRREIALQGSLVLAKCVRLELRDNILRTLLWLWLLLLLLLLFNTPKQQRAKPKQYMQSYIAKPTTNCYK